MNMLEELRSFLREKDSKDEINQNQLAKAAGVQQASLSKFIRGKQASIDFSTASKLMERLGISLRYPKAPEPREVCFVDAKIVQAGKGAPPPEAEDYLAVPLVGEAGAGPGIISQEDIESWILVYRKHRSVQRRSNLLAVEIEKGQASMTPTLHPEDIVLVDRDDWGQQSGYTPPGNIYLVREPGQEDGGMVKRVALAGKGDMGTITFYSDNKEGGPDTHLMSSYDHDLRQAIVGKVVWAWTDLSRK